MPQVEMLRGADGRWAVGVGSGRADGPGCNPHQGEDVAARASVATGLRHLQPRQSK